ncbi:MAG: YraN family protein [Gammaproteobacteria bacterium]|nr:YraN family protein [Gammaproteobacteria bacterium]
MNTSKRKGLHYEEQAKSYLLKQGLVSLQQNYHSRFGEIDLIMLDGDMLCFIEVKFRRSTGFGGAANSISYLKQQKIIKTAQIFINQDRKHSRYAMRFDALMLQQTGEDISIDWIQNAFYAE